LGLFVTFEGGEGCGKTYQSKILYRKLCQQGISTMLTYEPGGTILGDKIRHLLKKVSQEVISPESELFLITASRAQLVTEVISPSLLTHKIVICDRFTDSTLAYQGYGRGLDLEMLKVINSVAIRNINPNLTILLDMPVKEGLRRKRTSSDRFEMAGLSFHNRVREGYLKLADREPKRWLIVDAALSKATITNIVWDRVNQLLVP
jgi:dTMP kinase